MSDEQVFYIKIPESGNLRGPLSLEQLQDLVEGGALTPETEITDDPEQALVRIRQAEELLQFLFPPQKGLTLKHHQAHGDTEAASSTPPLDVRDILQQNLEKERGHGMKVDQPASDKDQRQVAKWRSYWILNGPTNLLCLILFLLFQQQGNVIALVFLVSFFTLFNVGLAWLFFWVMD